MNQIYQRLPSLQEYVLVDQEQVRVTLFRKSNNWKPEVMGKEENLSLPSIDFEQSLAELYEDILAA